MQRIAHPPRFLYKYVSENGIDLLRNSRIKVTPPKEFNDPFELLPSIIEPPSPKEVSEYYKNEEVQRTIYNEYGSGITRSPDFDDWRNICKDENFASDIPDAIAREFKNGTEYGQKIKEQISSQFGMVSLSETYDNLLMWSHYATSHRGFVVEINSEDLIWSRDFELLFATYSSERKPLKLRNWECTKVYPNKIVRFICRKSECWAYEKEWRAIFFLSRTRKKGGKFYLDIPTGVITKVIGGIQIRPDLESELRSVCSEYDIPFQRMIIHQSEYRLILPSE